MNDSELIVEVSDTYSRPPVKNTYVFNCPYCKKQTLLEHVEPMIECRVILDLSQDQLGNPYLSKDNAMGKCVTEYMPVESRFRCHNCKEDMGQYIYELATNGTIKFNANR